MRETRFISSMITPEIEICYVGIQKKKELAFEVGIAEGVGLKPWKSSPG